MKKNLALPVLALAMVWIQAAIPATAAKALWNAPAGEIIRQLRTGKSAGSVVVLTESTGKTKWWIREIGPTGNARLLASGTEKPCSILPMSALAYQGDHLVLCVKNRRAGQVDWKQSAAEIVKQADRCSGDDSSTYYLLDCSLSHGRAIPIMPGAPTISGTVNAGRFILGVHRAYSHDGRFIAFRGEDRAKDLGGRHVDGIWLYDSLKKTTKFIWSEHGWCDAAWDDRGLLYLFDRATGSLYRGPGEPLKLFKMIHPGTFGAIAPNGNSAVVVDQKASSWRIHVANLAGDGSEPEFKARNSSPAVDVEWSRDSKYAVIIGTGNHSVPVLVGPGPTIAELKDVAKVWRADSGTAFISDGALAVVDGSQSKIIRAVIK